MNHDISKIRSSTLSTASMIRRRAAVQYERLLRGHSGDGARRVNKAQQENGIESRGHDRGLGQCALSRSNIWLRTASRSSKVSTMSFVLPRNVSPPQRTLHAKELEGKLHESCCEQYHVEVIKCLSLEAQIEYARRCRLLQRNLTAPLPSQGPSRKPPKMALKAPFTSRSTSLQKHQDQHQQNQL